jgi:hypothetical protein
MSESVTELEPVELKEDLNRLPPESTLTRVEAVRLRDVLLKRQSLISRTYHEVVDAPSGVSPFRSAWNEQLDKSVTGTNPSGLRVKRLEQMRNLADFETTYYSILRLATVERVVGNLESAGFETINSSRAVALALYHAESNLSVPISLLTIRDRIVDRRLLKPCLNRMEVARAKVSGCIPHPYAAHLLGPRLTFTPRGADVEFIANLGAYLTGIKRNVTARKDMLRRQSAADAAPLAWLNTAKRGAFFVFMLLVGGLDFYTWDPMPVGTPDWLEDIFSYHFARNRLRAGIPGPFTQLRAEGRAIYRRICTLDPDAFRRGALHRQALIATLDERRTLHVLPHHGVEFTGIVLTEAMVRLEALSREPLIADTREPTGERWLPPTLAYLRYNGWDIYFVMFVLDALDLVLHGEPMDQLRKNKLFWNQNRRRSTQELIELRKNGSLGPKERRDGIAKLENEKREASGILEQIALESRDLVKALARLLGGLRRFRRPKPPSRSKSKEREFALSEYEGVWTVYGRWLDEGERYLLRHTGEAPEDDVRKRRAIRLALVKDAIETSRNLFAFSRQKLVGRNEEAFQARLRSSEGELDTALPLIDALTEGRLWGDLEQVMVARIGPAGETWLGSHGIGSVKPDYKRRTQNAELGVEIGENVVRFHHLLQSYLRVFP